MPHQFALVFPFIEARSFEELLGGQAFLFHVVRRIRATRFKDGHRTTVLVLRSSRGARFLRVWTLKVFFGFFIAGFRLVPGGDLGLGARRRRAFFATGRPQRRGFLIERTTTEPVVHAADFTKG